MMDARLTWMLIQTNHRYQMVQFHHQIIQVVLVVQVVEAVLDPTYIYGNFLKSCYPNPNCTAVVSVGSIAQKASLRSRIQFELLACGVNERTGQQWITTNSRVQFVNITRKESWKKLNDLNALSISFVIPIVSNVIPFIDPMFYPL